MSLKFSFFISFCFMLALNFQSYGQGGMWTWVKGVDTVNVSAVYGIPGVPRFDKF